MNETYRGGDGRTMFRYSAARSITIVWIVHGSYAMCV